MRTPLAFLLSASLIFLSSPLLAADLSITASPEKSDKAQPDDYAASQRLVTQTPGITAYYFAATWDELSNPEKNRIEEIKIAAHFGGEAKLPGYLGIQVINATRRGLSKEFRNARWSNPGMLVAFDGLLRNIQNTTGGNIKWVSIGNEADLYLAAEQGELDDFITFYKGVATSVRRQFPAAQIGITITYNGLMGDRKTVAEKLIAQSDAVFLTYAPITDDFKVKKDEEIEKELTDLLAMPFGKPLVFQEFGYPTSKAANGSDEDQAAFLKKYIPMLKASPNVELINLPALHDPTSSTCKDWQKYFEIKDRDAMVSRCSSGMIEDNGRHKPSWQVLLDTINPRTVPPAPVEPAPEK